MTIPNFATEALNLPEENESLAFDKMLEGMDALMHSGDWSTLDSLFKNIDCKTIKLSMSTFLVRFTPNNSVLLPSRAKFLKELRIYIGELGEDEKELLRGVE